MRPIRMLGLLALCISVAVGSVNAAEGKEKKEKRGAASAGSAAEGASPVTEADTKDTKGKKKNKDESDAADSGESKTKSESAEAKARRELLEAKESGGDESELNSLVQVLGLSDTQKNEIEKEFERYRARLAEIKALPDKSPNEKLLRGPQRRALREDLAKWITAHVSPGQAQKFEAYEKKRRRDLYDEHVTNRVTKLTEDVGLNTAQQEKVRTIYNVQLGGIQNAADELYAASRKAGASAAELEKALEAKRDAMKKAIEGVLKPDQLEKYKSVEE
ncbi:MAG: hypothetical protein HUU46_09135 [Candidatus Hydrogenedentes bacterium]|nr:hypothetical protein [Candidatus Hydrogenedentota bacterium]